MANRVRIAGRVATLIVITVASIGLYFFIRNNPENEIRELVRRAYNSQRPGGGRLSAASYSPLSERPQSTADLGRAQTLLLSQAQSSTRHTLQGLIYLAAGEWRKFIEHTSESGSLVSTDPSTLNNRGASLLALSENDPSLLLEALDAFDRANKLDPEAPEPLFNLVTTYRKLHFPKLASDYFQRYSKRDSGSEWNIALNNPPRIDEATIIDELERAVRGGNLIEAERLFRIHPELCRRVSMQHALSNQAEPEDLIAFIATQMEKHYGDKTVSAMIAPLQTEQRDTTIAVRSLVNRGATLYVEGSYAESLDAYDEAENLAGREISVFDHLWINLNRLDTQIRSGKFDAARERLSRIVPIAKQHGLRWMYARITAMYGSSLKLTSSYSEMLDLLTEADKEFIRLDALRDRIRVLYYLSAYRHFGGDQTEALKLALECLVLLNDDDAVRISTMDWLIGAILYRSGLKDKARLFAKGSVDQSQNVPYASGVQLQAAMSAAELSESMSEPELARRYFQIADDAFQKVPPGFDRIRYELMLGNVKARTEMNQNRFESAETLLLRNLKLYARQPFPGTPMLTRSLRLLAELYAQTGRVTEADRRFTDAIDVIEKDDEYLKLEGVRVKFDDERRESYDGAIEFEFRNGSNDAAWTYLQKYRAKLFLEFLAAFNPDIQVARARPDRSAMQRRIPRDAQILEYVLLKDRLLIWLVTDKLVIVRSVSVTRADIENKIQNVLEKLRAREDADSLLTELGQFLIEPVATVLDPNRSLIIIPDRALHGLPFDALKQPGKSEYLVERFSIVVSPSLTHFLASSDAKPPRNTIIGFGSQLNSASEFKELTSLSDVYPSAATFAGPQVDKASFLAGLRNASVFHYAGHSATDAADPLRSAILLDGKRSSPNSVTAIDISQQRMADNAVVILSSCDSSVGNARDGIGVRGLTSAFLIAGAGSVVGSLWPVEASSTADLMIRFHRGFAKDQMPVARALREAQLAFLKAFPERAHPYYWSGFVVTGNFSALR